MIHSFFNKFYRLVIILLLIMPSINLNAQFYNRHDKGFFSNFLINASGGLLLFQGDIKTDNRIFYKDDWQLAAGFALRKRISPSFSFGIQVLNGKLQGTRLNSADATDENFKFHSDVFEYNFNSTINFSNLLLKTNPERLIDVYGFAGIGYSNWRTQLVNLKEFDIISSSGDDGKGLKGRTSELVYPVGIGVRFNLGKNLGISLENTLRFVNSDDLDARIIEGTRNDFYTYTSIGISLKLVPEEKIKYAPKKRKKLNIFKLNNKKKIPSIEIPEIPQPLVLPLPISDSVYYTLQILAKREKESKIKHLIETFNIEEQIYLSYHKDSLYRYTIGWYEFFEEAVENLKIIIDNGITDAFIVKYQNGIRMPIWSSQIEGIELRKKED